MQMNNSTIYIFALLQSTLLCIRQLVVVFFFFRLALDPSEIGFTNTDPLVRVDKSDAIFVDVIHTDVQGKEGKFQLHLYIFCIGSVRP